MGEGERCGVQEVAIELKRGLRLRSLATAGCVSASGLGRKTDHGRRAVERIADDGMAERGHVDADLVGASGLDAHGDEGEAAEGRLDAAEHAIVADGRAAIVAACRHAGAADGIAGDGGVDRSAFGGDCAVHQRDVGLLHLAAREHVGQFGVGLVVLGDQEETAGLLVQPMHDAGTQRSAVRGELFEVMQQRVDQRAAVARVVGRSRRRRAPSCRAAC